jgi:hypothetical protein
MQPNPKMRRQFGLAMIFSTREVHDLRVIFAHPPSDPYGRGSQTLNPMPRRRFRPAQGQCRQPASQPRCTARSPAADRGAARGSSPGIAIMINVPVGRSRLWRSPTDFRKRAHSGASAERTGAGGRSGSGETAIAAGQVVRLRTSSKRPSQCWAPQTAIHCAAANPTSKLRQVDRLCVDHALLTGAVPDRPIGSNRA